MIDRKQLKQDKKLHKKMRNEFNKNMDDIIDDYDMMLAMGKGRTNRWVRWTGALTTAGLIFYAGGQYLNNTSNAVLGSIPAMQYQSTKQEVSNQPAEYWYFPVRGDTLFEIAEDISGNGHDWRRIQRLNGLDSDLIEVISNFVDICGSKRDWKARHMEESCQQISQ